MSVKALEGVVEDGQIRLPPDIRLPDQTMVYILIPDAQARPHIATPRLARPEQVRDLQTEVREVPEDAGV